MLWLRTGARLLLILPALFWNSPVLAAGIDPGEFELFTDDQAGSTECVVGTRLILVHSQERGDLASLENFAQGYCPEFVPPNPRTFHITSIEDDGGGGHIYKGSNPDAGESHAITIIDHRADPLASRLARVIQVVEEGPQGISILRSRRK